MKRSAASQVNAYLSIADEVYLVVESKQPPPDLPFYVGIIKVQDGIVKVVRRAQSLKHSIDINECWSTLINATRVHIGLKREHKLRDFFNAIETVKRKLIWNQFVIGFHQTYVEKYVSLTEKEKKVIKAFFDGEGE